MSSSKLCVRRITLASIAAEATPIALLVTVWPVVLRNDQVVDCDPANDLLTQSRAVLTAA